jgi:hypothetical protein
VRPVKRQAAAERRLRRRRVDVLQRTPREIVVVIGVLRYFSSMPVLPASALSMGDVHVARRRLPQDQVDLVLSHAERNVGLIRICREPGLIAINATSGTRSPPAGRIESHCATRRYPSTPTD